MELSEAQRASLDALTRQDGYDGSVSARARMVLWRADGFSVADIMRMSGASKPTVYKWVNRYERFGVDGLTDLPRTGRPPEVNIQPFQRDDVRFAAEAGLVGPRGARLR
jgi:Homeodomain-like domain-containing protein